jgi:hypothetical protein
MAAMSEPAFSNTALADVEVNGTLLHVRDLGPSDRPGLLDLHTRVFGQQASEDWYRWKYVDGNALGTGVWHHGELIAHCGGTPRTLWHEGRQASGIQIGDVMVAPEWRGILTRRGPFFQACDSFYARHVGRQAGHSIGYGFPNLRHMKLAVALKLAWDGGAVSALTWRLGGAAGFQAPGWSWRWTELHASKPGFDEVVEQAWSRMRERAAEFTLGERSCRYVRWRYCERPARSTRMFSLRRAWSREPVGIAVLDLGGAQAQWLDWIGEPAAIAHASRACVAQARLSGASSLVAWATDAVIGLLGEHGTFDQRVTARLGIPIASALDHEAASRAQWWFMGGDTDFL